VDVAGIEPAL